MTGGEQSQARSDHAAPTGDSAVVGDSLLLPLVGGGLATCGFYLLIPVLPIQREFAVRYFCGHPLEYITTALFFIGMSTLFFKALRFPTERAVFADQWLGSIASGNSDESGTTLTEKLNHLPISLRQTHLGRRVHDVSAYLLGRPANRGLEEHLKYLAELAADRVHASYAVVRTVTWAVPILGFLGTVIGITMAIANVTPEQLDTSLGEVTGGLAVAFDTTALALGLSLVMVFTSFFVEQVEHRVLHAVEEFGIEHLGRVATANEPSAENSLMSAERHAARLLMERTEAMVTEQTELWRASVEAMRARWVETLAGQTGQLESALTQGMSATLSAHAQELQNVRGEFLAAFQQATQQLAQQLERSNQAADAQLQELRQHGEAMLRLAANEEQLVRLERKLADNLETVRTAGAFDDTLHNLTAAVHLLTARAQSKAA